MRSVRPGPSLSRTVDDAIGAAVTVFYRSAFGNAVYRRCVLAQKGSSRLRRCSVFDVCVSDTENASRSQELLGMRGYSMSIKPGGKAGLALLCRLFSLVVAVV